MWLPLVLLLSLLLSIGGSAQGLTEPAQRTHHFTRLTVEECREAIHDKKMAWEKAHRRTRIGK